MLCFVKQSKQYSNKQLTLLDLKTGLEFLHNISNSYKSVVLRIDLVTFDDDHKYSQYINFRLNDKTTNYKLTAGTYSGSAGNLL